MLTINPSLFPTIYVNLYADYNKNGTYNYVDYFYIEEMFLYE